MSNLSQQELLKLCRRALEGNLLYSCGQSAPCPIVDHERSDEQTTVIKPIPPKPWCVRVAADREELYFTADELLEYLTNLLSSTESR